MLQALEVDNFKTLNQFRIEFSPLTVVVGNNASGKSTILQVLDLMCSSGVEDVGSILMRRGWNIPDLKSKCREKPSSKLQVSAEFILTVEEKVRRLRWELALQYMVQKNTMNLYSERVINQENGFVYLEYTDKGVSIAGAHGENIRFPRLSSDSSVMKVTVDEERGQKEYPELVILKRYLTGMRSF